MILLDVVQGSPAWEACRLGLPTASRYDEILTPKTLKASASAPKYRNQLLAEWLCGYAIDFGGKSGFMDRGTEMEPEARAWYEFDRGCDVTVAGFVLRDDGETGGSPDGLVDEDGGIEIKCPAIHTHIGYLLDPASLVAEYKGQTQGYMYLTGRAWWDVVSYNPQLPKVVQRIERDEEYISALDRALGVFIQFLNEAKEQLREHKLPTPDWDAVAKELAELNTAGVFS
jgi:hypothetical protein